MLSELHIGAAIFFTLSGYLLTKRYAGRRFTGAEWRRYLLHLGRLPNALQPLLARWLLARLGPRPVTLARLFSAGRG